MDITSPVHKEVTAYGSPNANICFIGEVPGDHENALGMPFTGISGKLLRTVCAAYNIDLADCYITNVFKRQPPNNDMDYYFKDKKRTQLTPAGQEQVTATIEELKTTHCNIYILLGNIPLATLTEFNGINKYRGYMVDTYFNKQAMATVNPAAVLRQFSTAAGDYNLLLRLDISKAVDIAKGIITPVKERIYTIPKTYREKLQAIKSFTNSEYLSFDIEGVSNGILCIGFANNNASGTCITFMRNYRWLHTVEQRAKLWLEISKLLHGPSKKIGQNVQFDYAWLGRNYNIRPVNVWCDTMIAHHIAWPELRKGLDTLASLYTVEPFWKDDTDDWNAIKNWDVIYTYNIKDCCVTLDIAMQVMKQLDVLNLQPVYQDYLTLSLGPVLKTVINGINYNHAFIDDYIQYLELMLTKYQTELTLLAESKLNANSSKQVAAFVYGKLHYPKQYSVKNGKRSVSTDYNALAKCMKHKDTRALHLILSCRRLHKLLSTYGGMKIDPTTRRIHTSYNVCGTNTGRLSSSKSPFGSGGNLQNLPRPQTESEALMPEDRA